MIDLNPKHFETVQHILAQHVPGCEVRAFGSRVKWTAKDYSDLDLAVVSSKPLSWRQRGQLTEAFEESDLPIRVDVLDWHTISDGFKKIIAEEYEVIQGAKPLKAKEQRRIAHILGTLDDKIELNRQMNETLEAMARAIFKSWFVNFDLVKAKMEGKKPVGMDTETAALFPSAFRDSPLGKIPEGWTVKKIGDLVEIVKGRSYRSSELTESDTALVTLKSIMRGGGYRPNGLKPYTGKYKPEQIITPGELVVSYTDVTQEAEVVGKPAIVRGNEKYQTLVASLDLGIIRPLASNISVWFLYCLFRERRFQSHIYGYADGTTVLHLSKDGVPSYQFALPPEKIRCLFDLIVEPLFAKIESNENETRTLAQTRDTLLPKLLSGEIRVSDPDKILEGI